MAPKIKVCGVRDVETMRACVEHGVDYVGLNFAPGSRRCIDVRLGRELVGVAAGSDVLVVAVFRDAPPSVVLQIATAIGAHAVQLHGSETPQACATVRERFPVIKALSIDDWTRQRQRYEEASDYLLVDAARPGSGESWDYQSCEATESAFLAGGLTPENVGAAISAAAPFAVDTASGVEVDGEPSPERVAEFCEAVRCS